MSCCPLPNNSASATSTVLLKTAFWAGEEAPLSRPTRRRSLDGETKTEASDGYVPLHPILAA